MTDKLVRSPSDGLTIGSTVTDKRNGRMGAVVWMSAIQVGGDVLLRLKDANGEWTAYVRQVWR